MASRPGCRFCLRSGPSHSNTECPIKPLTLTYPELSNTQILKRCQRTSYTSSQCCLCPPKNLSTFPPSLPPAKFTHITRTTSIHNNKSSNSSKRIVLIRIYPNAPHALPPISRSLIPANLPFPNPDPAAPAMAFGKRELYNSI